MKKHFTETQIETIKHIVRKSNIIGEASVNKFGNITIHFNNKPFWLTLYAYKNKNGIVYFVWRKLWKDRCGGYRSHLLNVHGRNNVQTEWGFYKDWTSVEKNAGMWLFIEAEVYLKKYLKKMK